MGRCTAEVVGVGHILILEDETQQEELRALEKAHPWNPGLQQQLFEAKELLALFLEKVRCFNHRKYMIEAHAKCDKAGTLLACLTNTTSRISQILEVESDTGLSLYGQEDIKHRLEEYYTCLYAPLLEMLQDTVVAVLGPALHLSVKDAEELGNPIKVQEVRSTINTMAPGKVLGTDSFSITFYTAIAEDLAPKLVDLSTAARDAGRLLTTTGEALVILS
ncbi:hypothetical protein NDU88_006973 [Pleurodeles waltl]|uniref:Uncharacterized protein n=1 Tax=Pleurodeles waltl TaxID=8319 RepID=A0AAV7N0T6_PLEWA|nr:hypothetical protein NDU88_006973 [Pleurodeles waltl]